MKPHSYKQVSQLRSRQICILSKGNFASTEDMIEQNSENRIWPSLKIEKSKNCLMHKLKLYSQFFAFYCDHIDIRSMVFLSFYKTVLSRGYISIHYLI